jgi:hypothetical protein
MVAFEYGMRNVRLKRPKGTYLPTDWFGYQRESDIDLVETLPNIAIFLTLTNPRRLTMEDGADLLEYWIWHEYGGKEKRENTTMGDCYIADNLTSIVAWTVVRVE